VPRAAGEGVSLEAVIEAQRERSKTLKDMAAASRLIFEAPQAYEEKSASKQLTPETASILLETKASAEALVD
jgi:glutamyl-tRNA synthetase